MASARASRVDPPGSEFRIMKTRCERIQAHRRHAGCTRAVPPPVRRPGEIVREVLQLSCCARHHPDRTASRSGHFKDEELQTRQNAASDELLAEAVRFELTKGFPLPVFKTGAIDHSATLPRARSAALAAHWRGPDYSPLRDGRQSRSNSAIDSTCDVCGNMLAMPAPLSR